jgi:hypothetical protein
MHLSGGCACGAVRYELTAPALIVHACHCRDCQRLTGSAFVISLWIERALVETTATPRSFALRGGSGKANVHIFTRSKLPWLELPRSARVFEAMYRLEDAWPPESLERLRRAIARRT